MKFPNESAEYRAARDRLLAKEAEERRVMEEVAMARRALPEGGLLKEDYLFEEVDSSGAVTKTRFSELFAPGKDTLVVYNFMFPRDPQDDRPPGREIATRRLSLFESPCPSCVALLDQLDGAARHVGAKLNFVVIAKTAATNLDAFGKERGWRFLRLLSARDNTFKRDYHGETVDGAQRPMLSVFIRSAGEIRHFWSCELLYAPPEPGQDPRHLGTLEPLWNIFDLTRKGRPSGWEEQLSYPE
jgi:predicted dithiol-disulfide oxidoreductase (DUF899 family)